MADPMRLGGLWKNQRKSDGKPYLSGNFNFGMSSLTIQIWPNENKANDKAPDYRVIAFPREDPEKARAAQGEQRQRTQTSYQREPQQSPDGYRPGDDDIPF